MASIDKIYCDSRKDFVQFYEWCEMFEEECYKETGELLTDYFYLTPLEWPEQDKYRRDVPVTNTPFNIDKWLNLHCPIKFVRDRLLEWGYKPSRKQLLYIEKGFDREKYRQKKTIKALEMFIQKQERYKSEDCVLYNGKHYNMAVAALNKILAGDCRYKFAKLNLFERIIY